MPSSPFEMTDAQLAQTDWSRHSVGFGPALKDPDAQAALGTIPLTQTEMRVLQLFLNKQVPGTDEIPALVFPGLKTMSDLLSIWLEWSAKRGMP